ncbi:hypothetical protein B0O99DRAFT_566099 [Bisporella sp. PMI_857]|nr:hypothetical protein B0O99DRAFT_566099 [Bisporella sp. PMI_857]
MAQLEPRPSLSPPSYSSRLEAAPPTRRQCPHCTPSGERLPPEEDLNQPLPGWPNLARIITDNPGLEAFQSFRDLNIKSLLYYQAELHQLRAKLHNQEWTDLEGHRKFTDCEEEFLNESVEHLLESKYKQDRLARKQFDLITEIREVLEKYNAALIQYSQITAFPKAEPFNVTTLRRLLIAEPVALKINGAGSQSWGDIDIVPTISDPQNGPSIGQLALNLLPSLFRPKKREEDKLDLIFPHSDYEVDGLTRWVATKWIPFVLCFRKWWKKVKILPPDVEKALGAIWPNTRSQEPICPCKKAVTLNTFSKRRILHFTSGVATITACALPVAAITVLSKLHSNSEVLGVIALFAVAFAAGLMSLSGGARSVDIFTATAAYVFLS